MPAPVNDNFASATTITGSSGTSSGTTVDATNEVSEPLASFPGVWYKYTAPSTGVYQFDFSAYSGSASGLVLLTYADAGFPTGDSRLAQFQPSDSYLTQIPRVNLKIASGASVYFKVGTFGAGQTFTLRWVSVTPPADDDFANAGTVVEGLNSYDLTNASYETPDEPNLSSTYHRSIWKKFVAPRAGVYNFKTIGGDTPRGRVYRQDGTGLTGLFNMLGSSGALFSTSGANATLVAGVTYWVPLQGHWDMVETVQITFPPICVLATADPNTASTTVTVLGDAVREKQKTDYLPAEANGENLDHGAATAAFYVRGANLPPPGHYTVTASYRRNSSFAVNESGWNIFLKLNGKIIGPVQDSYTTATGVIQSQALTGQTSRALGPDTFPIYSVDDVIDVCAQNDFISGTPNGIEITQICFTKVGDLVPTEPLYYPATMSEPETPLGGTSYDPAWANVNKFPDTKDMVVTDNGDIYVLTAGRHPAGGGLSTVRLSKYTASAGTWAIINDDVWGFGNPGSPSTKAAWTAALATDGTDVWMAWIETTTHVRSSIYHYVWRCIKYDTGADTYTELGTGQSYYPSLPYADIGPFGTGSIPNAYDARVALYISPSDVLWAAWPEEYGHYLLDTQDFTGSAGNLDGGTLGFNSLTGSNPATIDGSGNAQGGGAGETGSYFTVRYGQEVPTTSTDDLNHLMFVIDTPPTGTDWIGVEYRISGEGTGSRNSYRLVIKGNNDIVWEKFKVGVADPTVIYTDVAPLVWAAGDRLYITCEQIGVSYYKWDASAATPTWTLINSLLDPGMWNPPISVETTKSAVVFKGTSGKISKLRSGNSLFDQRACAQYWSGSAWVDSGLELIPGGFRRNLGGQIVGVVNNAYNEKHVQLAFAHADGPNDNPSICFCTEHSAPGIIPGYENQEIQIHYNEYNGTSWDNPVSQGTYAIFGNAMYETANTAPNYYASNGFFEGFTFLKAEDKPWLIATICTHSSFTDLTGSAPMNEDGTGFVGEATGHPDDPMRLYTKTAGNGPYLGYTGCIAVEDSAGQIFLWRDRNDDQFGGWLWMRTINGEDLGTGSQWTVGATLNNRLWYLEGQSYDQLALDRQQNLYVITDLWASSGRNGSYVYKWDCAVPPIPPQIASFAWSSAG